MGKFIDWLKSDSISQTAKSLKSKTLLEILKEKVETASKWADAKMQEIEAKAAEAKSKAEKEAKTAAIKVQAKRGARMKPATSTAGQKIFTCTELPLLSKQNASSMKNLIEVTFDNIHWFEPTIKETEKMIRWCQGSDEEHFYIFGIFNEHDFGDLQFMIGTSRTKRRNPPSCTVAHFGRYDAITLRSDEEAIKDIATTLASIMRQCHREYLRGVISRE